MGMTFICCYNFLKQIIFSIHGKEVNNKNPQSSKTIVVNRSLLYCEWLNELPEKSQEASKIAAKFFCVFKNEYFGFVLPFKSNFLKMKCNTQCHKMFLTTFDAKSLQSETRCTFLFFYCGTRIIMWCQVIEGSSTHTLKFENC